MGFFDRFAAKKPAPEAAPRNGADVAATPSPTPSAGGVKASLIAAREKLEAKDLPGALTIYEELLATAGDRADVLVTISGDLGSQGHVAQIIELVAPRYDADRHGPATGLNLLQAYLAVRNADAAQHVLDILFALNRPELEDRLHGFSNAIADLLVNVAPPADFPSDGSARPEPPKISMISISKPIWFYGLEAMAAKILPAKVARPRTLAFCQLAVLGPGAAKAAANQPDEELNRLARGFPLWLAETFSFAPQYSPIAAVGLLTRSDAPNQPARFDAEWTTEHLRQLVDSVEGGLDYAFTGALRQQAGDYEIVVRVWEVKKYRERKLFRTRWTPGTADVELTRLHEQIRTFMEWSPAKADLVYAPPARPRAWLDQLDAALGLFLAEKKLLPVDSGGAGSPAEATAPQTAATEIGALAFLTHQARRARLGLPRVAGAPLSDSPLVDEARNALG